MMMVAEGVQVRESLKKRLAGESASTGFENSLNKICIHLVGVHHTGTPTQEGLREKATETEWRIKAAESVI